MKESKIVLTRRLTRENRWEEASLFKDSKIKELKAEGMKRAEANEAAWEAMGKKYPPIENPEEGKPEVAGAVADFTPEQIANLPPGSLKNFLADSDWVYSNLELGESCLDEPPSTGALGLLSWARAHRNDFYGKILPKALQLQDKRPETTKQQVEANLAHVRGLAERYGKKPPGWSGHGE